MNNANLPKHKELHHVHCTKTTAWEIGSQQLSPDNHPDITSLTLKAKQYMLQPKPS